MAAFDADDEIVWEEQADVFRPTPVQAEAFLRALDLETNLKIADQTNAVFIRRTAYDTLRAHLNSDLTVEQGGLLFGRVFQEESRGLYLLVIEKALPARDGIETPTSLEYTPATWEHLTPEFQQMRADWTVIGSYHSHPGLGVFLSSTDRATQVDVFPHAWQVAIVCDPVTGAFGFFVGPDGTPCEIWSILADSTPLPC